MLHYQIAMQREQQMQARMIEAVAFGYGGVKSDKGNSAMQRILALLRGK